MYGANNAKKLAESNILTALARAHSGQADRVDSLQSKPERGEAEREEEAAATEVLPPEPRYTEPPFVPLNDKEPQVTDYDDSVIAESDLYPEDIKIAAEEAAAALAEIAVRRSERAEERTEKKEVKTGEVFAEKTDWEAFNNIAPKVQKRTESEEKDNARKNEPEYFLSVKKDLDELFSKHPPEEELGRELKSTRWARVPYTGGRHYVIGLIGQPPEYIAYGVPGRFSLNPPKELECVQWLPVYEGDPQGKGYWVMYQDAKTGEAVDLTII
jgi:hypothetical protein